jgi:hypothetical protein
MHAIFAEKSDGLPSCTWDDNIKMNHKEMG